METGRTSVAKLRIAVVGCGAIAQRHHLPSLRYVAGTELVAVVDCDFRRAQEVSTQFGVPKAFDDWEVLTPDIADIAIVCVPNNLHFIVAKGLLERGIHVLCEKPLATTVWECEQLWKTAQRTGYVLAVGHHMRFMSNLLLAREILLKGCIGDVHHFCASLGAIWHWDSVTGFYFNRKRAGGGVILDTGVHVFDLVHWLIGKVEEVRCDATLTPGEEVESEARISVYLANGISGVIRLSRLRWLTNTLMVKGEDGFIEASLTDSSILKFWSSRARVSQNWGAVTLATPCIDPYRRQLEEMRDVVKGSRSRILADGKNGQEAVRVAELAYESLGSIHVRRE